MNRDAVEEKSPFIDRIELVYAVPYLEVYMWAWVDEKCFQIPKVDVQIEAPSLTKLIPKLQKKDMSQKCSQLKLKNKRIKIADLDPSQESSYHVKVLGNLGWHEQFLERK
jgi:hypothetical protein